MRLTLRTLLSYLDDTLEPSQAKIIGTKVSESDQARELMERIKQVTRRRRLTTPPPSGPGGIDANTIAEYLDNEVTPEQAAEVEQICLASEVHLAEVAACHQILTLVLGEPAPVPPTAKQRMYALVKGPEAIHSRKPARSAKPEMDLSSEIEPDQDETLRMGVPAIGKSDSRNLWILIGGGVLAASLLLVAVWQLVHTPSPNVVEPKGDAVVQANGKDQSRINPKEDPTNPPAKDGKKETESKKDPTKVTNPPKKEETFPIQVIPVPIEQPVEMPYQPASTKQVTVGQYVMPGIKEPGILLQKADKIGTWVRIGDKSASIVSGRPVLSMPGSKSLILLNSGAEVLLWGSLPEMTLDPMHLESSVILHANDQLAADLTLLRGRIQIKNKIEDKDARVRLRFENPTNGEENYFDIILQGKGATLTVERASELNRNERFFENPKDPYRNGPSAIMTCYATARSANVRSGQVSYTIDESQPVLQWKSANPVLEPAPPTLPLWLKDIPPLKGDAEVARKNAIKAHEVLVNLLANSKPIDVALAEMVQKVDENAQREIASDKRMSQSTYAQWQHVIRCYTALDDISYLFGEFSKETTEPRMLMIRGLCMLSLNRWLGLQRDHDYQMLELLRSNTFKYKKTESIKIMELFHKIPEADALKPATYQMLIEGLNNDRLAIRVLCHWHLSALVPAGNTIPYDPTAPRAVREAAVREWTRLIPVGQLPPSGPPVKKDKA